MTETKKKRKNSRAKGASGEREFAACLRELGVGNARRGVQYQGGAESPDVVGIHGIHFEVKRTEALRLEDAMAQSAEDAADGAVPVVASRRNRGEWLVTFRLRDIWRLGIALEGALPTNGLAAALLGLGKEDA